MATTGLVLSFFLFLAISAFVQIASADGVPAFYAASGSRHLGQIDCGAACDYRCSKASFQDRCLKYCNICCTDCNCVPPGTAGNKEVCPCYNNKKNSKGGPKCP